MASGIGLAAWAFVLVVSFLIAAGKGGYGLRIAWEIDGKDPRWKVYAWVIGFSFIVVVLLRWAGFL